MGKFARVGTGRVILAVKAPRQIKLSDGYMIVSAFTWCGAGRHAPLDVSVFDGSGCTRVTCKRCLSAVGE